MKKQQQQPGGEEICAVSQLGSARLVIRVAGLIGGLIFVRGLTWAAQRTQVRPDNLRATVVMNSKTAKRQSDFGPFDDPRAGWLA